MSAAPLSPRAVGPAPKARTWTFYAAFRWVADIAKVGLCDCQSPPAASTSSPSRPYLGSQHHEDPLTCSPQSPKGKTAGKRGDPPPARPARPQFAALPASLALGPSHCSPRESIERGSPAQLSMVLEDLGGLARKVAWVCGFQGLGCPVDRLLYSRAPGRAQWRRMSGNQTRCPLSVQRNLELNPKSAIDLPSVSPSFIYSTVPQTPALFPALCGAVPVTAVTRDGPGLPLPRALHPVRVPNSDHQSGRDGRPHRAMGWG